MFDIDSGKLLIVAVLALIVIGPKELPRVMRQVGQAIGKMRRMATEFQGQFMDAMKEADIADIRKELDDLNKSAALDVHFDPARDIQAELTSVMAPTGSVSSAASVPSPVEHFALPAVNDEALGEAAAFAPVAEEVAAIEAPSAAEALNHVNGNAFRLDPVPGKRKIFIKRRSSSFNLVQAEHKAAMSGEPLIVQRRQVRPKAVESHGVQNS